MSLYDEIRIWIEQDGPFLQGLTYLRQLGRSTAYFNKWSNKSYVPTHIKSDLLNILAKAIPEPSGDFPPLSSPGHKPIILDEPEVIQNLRMEGKQFLKERAKLHTLMTHSDLDRERFEYAREIVSRIQPEIDRIYGWISAFEEDGELPPVYESDQVVRETVQKMQRRDSLKVRISRLRRLLKNKSLEKAKRAAYEREKSEKIQELDSINSELGLGAD